MTTEEDLRRCSLFTTLGGVQLAAVAATTSRKECDAGTTIFQEGDSADDFYVLLEGRVALQMSLPSSRSALARRVTIDIVTPGQVFGWSAVAEPHEYTLAAVCLQRSSLLSINGARLEQVLRQDPETGFEVMKGFVSIVASRLNDTRHVLVSERSVQ